MKRYVISLVMALVALCSITIAASAAGTDPGITVQLDGQNLEFTDAKPQVKDNRTFLPYRAVFEAMGAEVGYEGTVVTAKRGDTELSMTIGETTATVTCGGAAEELTMDVAPYVDNTTWRTYVPVRFAADAFGCNVGWDQAAQTVIIVDVDPLVDEALAGKEFTLLKKYMEYSEKYNEGNWTINGTMDASAALLGSEEFPVLTGTVDGIVSGNAAGEMNMTLDLDMATLMSHIAALQGATLAEMGVTEEDLRTNMTMDMKMDMDTGAMYLKMDDAMNAQMGLPAGAWMSMDLNAILAESGMEWDYDALLAMAGEIDLIDVLKATLAVIPLDDMAADGYTTLAGTLNTVITALSDEGFQKTDNGYLSFFSLNLESLQVFVDLTLNTTASGEVNGYSAAYNLIVPFDEETKAELAASGIPADGISMMVQTALDQNDNMTAEIGMSMGTLFTLVMNMDMDYNTTTEAPDTALPTGAVIVDYMDLMAGIADLQG